MFTTTTAQGVVRTAGSDLRRCGCQDHPRRDSCKRCRDDRMPLREAVHNHRLPSLAFGLLPRSLNSLSPAISKINSAVAESFTGTSSSERSCKRGIHPRAWFRSKVVTLMNTGSCRSRRHDHKRHHTLQLPPEQTGSCTCSRIDLWAEFVDPGIGDMATSMSASCEPADEQNASCPVMMIAAIAAAMNQLPLKLIFIP